MSLLLSQLNALVAQERVLDEELRRLAMLHYRALAGRSAQRAPSALPSATSIASAHASCALLSASDTEVYGALLRRLTHLRAAAASSAASATSATPGGSTGGGAGVAALDLLELPALMETCVRSAVAPGREGGLATSSASGDDAVDLLEFALSLFANHKLLEPAIAALGGGGAAEAPSQLAPGAAAAASSRANPAAAALLVHIVREVAALAAELQAGLAHSLSARAPLPVVLKAVALLRRLARLQKRAALGSSSSSVASVEAEEGSAAAVAAAEETSAWLRWLFISERDGALARELEAAAGDAPHSHSQQHSDPAASLPSSAAAAAAAAAQPLAARQQQQQQHQPPLLRILEQHRTLCTELISQYGAVSSSLAGRGGAGGAGSAEAAARPLLVEALGWRAGSMLAAACAALTRTPEGHMATAQQPMAYAARRSARLGLDYAAPLASAWGAAVLDAVGGRLALARRLLAGADAREERASLSLLSASLRASLDVFNALRNCLPRALQAQVLGEFLAHFHALADSPVVAEWPSCAGAFSEAAEPFLEALGKLLPVEG